MATVLQLRQRLAPLVNKEVVYGIFFESVKAFEAYLIDLNQIRLEDGEDVFGNLTGTYSKSTELESLFGEGPRPIRPKVEGEPYNFQWTGGLFDGMRIDIFSDSAEFDSTDPKTGELKRKYGQILGLQERDLEEAIRERLFPDFIKRFRQRLGYAAIGT
ncbi:hypothetical protein FGF1_03390 [Flavobacteriaceae bacterium GF1]